MTQASAEAQEVQETYTRVSEKPWVEVSEVCEHYGLKFPSAKHAIAEGRFPVPTYKIGRLLVIDRAVHVEFFNAKRAASLHAFRNNQML